MCVMETLPGRRHYDNNPLKKLSKSESNGRLFALPCNFVEAPSSVMELKFLGYCTTSGLPKDGGFCLTPRRPALPPDEFRLQGFEEGLDGGIEAPIFVKRWSEMLLGDIGG